MIDCLLIYPKLGSMDALIVDLPLSIVYAAADSIKRGYKVKCLDLRIVTDWPRVIDEYFKAGVRLAGISVMTGNPLKNAREVSLYIKQHYPQTQIIWGGPHATVLPETITEKYIDFLIRGYGSLSLAELIATVKNGTENFTSISGLSYKKDNSVIHNERAVKHELINFRDLPYHLVDIKNENYARKYNQQLMFPIFSSIGCPYQCAFCVHPEIYKVINGAKWLPYPEEEVIAHIEYIRDNFGTNHIVFLDDTTFPDIPRMRRIFFKIIEKNLQISMEFRGARINEIDKMDDEFIELMIKAGGKMMMVGIESGSERVRNIFNKGISDEQIYRVSAKLAKYPQMIVHYNFFYGTPGETYADLLESKNMIQYLMKENPDVYIGFGGDWKPTPGTQMLFKAERDFGYKVPKTMDEWIEIDTSDAKEKITHPWYTKKQDNLIKFLQLASFVFGNKVVRESKDNKSLFFFVVRLLLRIYKPIAELRMKFDFYSLMLEYTVWQKTIRFLAK